jgi:hypothetical protein
MTTESITNKQLEILILLYRFRFLNRIHIQKFLNHKNPTRITPWLKDLTDKHIISRIYTQTLGEINKPAIYYLANKARQVLKENEKCNPDTLNRVYREKHRSEVFRNHWLFIADLYFHFQETAQKQNSTCNFYTATDLSTVAYAPLPLPDAFLTITEGQKPTKRYFLDLLDETLPMFAIKKRIYQYCRYYQANYWQDHNKHPFPKILLVCPTPRVKNSLLRFISKTVEEEEVDLSFFLSLKSDVRERGIQASTWEAVQ